MNFILFLKENLKKVDTIMIYFSLSTYLWVVMSGMYGKLVVLLMLAFCLTEVLDNGIEPLMFQVRLNHEVKLCSNAILFITIDL